MSRKSCRYCHRAPTGVCACCCPEHESLPQVSVRRFIDAELYDPSPEPIVRRAS